ncbi:MAG: BamA/TamA family outer membrane protein [Balneolaceae bacterium]|nr:BamA/TamA family outer membrane protein [Balneolaceae bacterium]
MNKALSILLLLAALAASLPSDARAQDGEAVQADSTREVVRIIRFAGNNHVADRTLEDLIRTHTNREFLGIPRFTPWYFLHRLTGRFGEPPALLDRATVATDMERIARYYQTLGFLDAAVDTNIVEFKSNRVEVSFLIREGPRSTISTLAYTGMPALPDEVEGNLQAFYRNSPLTREQVDDTTFRVDRPYSQNDLRNEQTRIINFLKNRGFASIRNDSVNVLVRRDSADASTLDLLFTVRPGSLYTFGDLHISLQGPDRQVEYDQHDTLSGPPQTTGGTRILMEKESEAQTRFSLLTDQILFQPGEVFNNERYIRSINEFQNLGMLNIRQFGLSEDGSLPDFSRPEIPVMFSLQTLPRHALNFNLFGMRRYGFGSGAGVTYTNNNLFGKAENLRLSMNGSFEYVRSETIREIAADSAGQGFSGSLFRSFEVRSEYTLPRLIFPFASLDDRLFFSNARTRYSLAFTRSNQLLFDINSDVRFNLRYEIQHNPRHSSFLDLVELDVLDTDPSPEFRQSLQQEYGEDSFEYQRILEDFRPQVSSILRYTFRSQRTDLIKRNYGYFSEYSISMGGNVPWLVDRLIVTPDTLEGNLPSPIRTSDNSLTYSRFLKATADYRRYIPLTNDAVFAYRGFIGLAYPYGKSTTIPLNQRFYAGGSNDIRGWDFYSLGPGSIPLDEVAINGGDIKLLAQTELRQQLIPNLIGANWIGAWFADAGNIWYGPRTEFPGPGASRPAPDDSGVFSVDGGSRPAPEEGKFRFDRFYKQIAVGSGLGIRIDWDYVVARFDFAFRVHDLQDGWLQNRKLYFSFGIGHSF